MPVGNDQVLVQVSLSSSKTPTRQGFGVLLIAAFHNHYADVVRIYNASNALTQMVSDGFSVNEGAYKAVSVTLSQNPSLTQIAIGKRILAFTQTLKLTCTDSTTGHVYKITVVGTDGASHAITYTVPGSSSTTTVATAITALLAALTNIGTPTSSSAVITITQTAGSLIDLQSWTRNFQIQDTTADPGIATDLAAIRAANNLGWYGLALDSNSPAEVKAAAQWVEATGIGGKTGWFNTSDDQDTQNVNTDVFSLTQALALSRSLIQHNGKQILCYAGCSAAGYALSHNPGSYAMSYKSQPNVPADDDNSVTESERLTLNTKSTASPGNGGKNGNYYAIVQGLPGLFWGATPAGGYIDNTISLDWIQVNVQANVYAALASLPKIPLTDYGIGIIGDAILSVLNLGASSAYGMIDATRPITLNLPKAATISPTDRANRNLPLTNPAFTAFFTGAVDTVEIVGVLSP